jgi:hypothetical protein
MLFEIGAIIGVKKPDGKIRSRQAFQSKQEVMRFAPRDFDMPAGMGS